MIYSRKRSFFGRIGINNLLILINVGIWLLITIGLLLAGSVTDINDSFLRYIAINPELFFQGYVWTLLTSMFAHIGFAHLFVNMISMFFVGSLVERVIGRKRFFWFYMIAGAVAGLFFVGFAYLGLFVPFGEEIFGGVNAFAVGASGALFGLGGLLAVLIPKLRVKGLKIRKIYLLDWLHYLARGQLECVQYAGLDRRLFSHTLDLARLSPYGNGLFSHCLA